MDDPLNWQAFVSRSLAPVIVISSAGLCTLGYSSVLTQVQTRIRVVNKDCIDLLLRMNKEKLNGNKNSASASAPSSETSFSLDNSTPSLFSAFFRCLSGKKFATLSDSEEPSNFSLFSKAALNDVLLLELQEGQITLLGQRAYRVRNALSTLYLCMISMLLSCILNGCSVWDANCLFASAAFFAAGIVMFAVAAWFAFVDSLMCMLPVERETQFVLQHKKSMFMPHRQSNNNDNDKNNRHNSHDKNDSINVHSISSVNSLHRLLPHDGSISSSSSINDSIYLTRRDLSSSNMLSGFHSIECLSAVDASGFLQGETMDPSENKRYHHHHQEFNASQNNAHPPVSILLSRSSSSSNDKREAVAAAEVIEEEIVSAYDGSLEPQCQDWEERLQRIEPNLDSNKKQ